MPCPNQQLLLKLFNNLSTSFHLLFLILFSSAIFLLTFLTFTGRFPLIQRDQQYEYVYSEDDDEESEEEYSCVDSTEREDMRKKELFVEKEEHESSNYFSEEFISPRESLIEDNHYYCSDTLSLHNSPQVSDFDNEQEFLSRDNDDALQLESTSSTSPININLYKTDNHVGLRMIKNKKKVREPRDDKFFVFSSTQLKCKKLMEEKDDDEESSEWRRSSIHCRDSSGSDEDELSSSSSSSSSTKSCPKWESYTLFDEEREFLDRRRIGAQKLDETESLRSIQRSISERINKKPVVDVGHKDNPYVELEAAYVAQICLTWEALSWNYKNYRSKQHDGCPATIAQQFQQFQVLLQRYIENEPYEHGRRPEIYARMRLLAPKLLLVPQYHQDAEGNQKDSDDNFHSNSKISSASFIKIMEDGMRTFMNFLKTDKEKPCHIVADYFRRNRRRKRGSIIVDPTLLRLMKKVNQKKRVKVKDVRHYSGNKLGSLRKRKSKEEEMDILMALIDLKVVSRVLRMNELSEQQLHWCEEKMSKVRVVNGTLETDFYYYSTPLFFPSLTTF